ncbi:MAG: DUF2336 domain-containing protein [Maricaulaceae bacterium]|nr:DUF2336 domain-containing protein [Maricaulaceae bacterium]
MTVVSKLHRLVDLARERSSERRRDLLREITNLFFDAPPEQGSAAGDQFDDVLSRLAAQTAQDARAELSRRFADSPLAPRGLIMQLARDAVEVAAPVLQKSAVLTEDDLVRLAEDTGPDHLKAISQRERVPERVSDVIVRKGDDETLAVLVGNEGAALSRHSYEAVARRAETSPALQAPLVARAATPPDLLNDLMLVVETSLREQIMRRFESIEPEALEEAMALSHRRLSERLKQDQELEEAQRRIAAMKLRRQLDGPLLARLLREGDMPAFLAGFAELTEIDIASARRAIESESVDPLALACKAAGFDKALFVTLAVLRGGAASGAIGDARELGAIYDALTADDARRAMRFWRMRKELAA